MLSLEKPITIDGITVFRDHADPNQFWYLPGPIDLARRGADDRLAFSFMKYKAAVADAGIKGGGFLTFESTLKLPESTAARLAGRLQAEPGVSQPVRLSAATFEEGTVQCIALNVQGAGGTAAAAPPAGAFNAVDKILGASIPSLDAENKAAFSLTLTTEGAIILEQAFSDGLAPIGVIYDLKYLAMRPAINVEITADFERIFNHFSASLEAQYKFFRIGIDAAFESLVQNGAITIKVLSFTGEDDEKEQERWALEFFKEELLSKWFEPTLTPGQLAVQQAESDPLSEVINAGRDILGNSTGSSGTSGSSGSSGASGTAGTSGTAGAQGSGGQLIERIQPATLVVERRDPDPLPQGFSVTHTPVAQGLEETIVVTGAGATVKVGGRAVSADANGRVSFTVDPNSEKTIEVDWPAQTEEQVFGLFFDFDKPEESGWRTNPPSTTFRSYVENTTTDPRFRDASGLLRLEGDGVWSGPERGADRLKAWIQGLPLPRQVRLDAYASHEHVSSRDETVRAQHNMRLSRRRLDVAQAIVQRAGGVIQGTPTAHGDTPANTRPGTHSPMGGDPDNRVVHVAGRANGGRPIQFRGRLRRSASVRPEQPPTPTPTPKPATPTQPAQPSGSGSSGAAIPAVASLKLKFVRQEERKTMTFRYNRAEAVRRTYAPQGFFGLLLKDLDDKSKYFTEIDLDHPFFREFAVQASVPIDFAQIGLSSAQIALDYGDPADAQNHKHGDFVFTPMDTGPKEFRVFMNATHDIDYTVKRQYHFDPQSGWEGDRFSYNIPEERTEDRTLFINPYENIEFLQVTVLPGEVDWEVVSSIEVRLQAQGFGNPEPRKSFILVQDSREQLWRLRGERPAPVDRKLTYMLLHHIKDGTVQEEGPFDLTVPILVVNDPFPDALHIEFIPLFDSALTQRVFIEVEYDDVANAYERRERREMPGTQTDPVTLRIALRNKDLRRYRYRLTFVAGGGFDQRAWIDTSEELIAVR